MEHSETQAMINQAVRASMIGAVTSLLGITTLILVLVSCTTAPADIQAQCLPLKTWTPAQQLTLKSAFNQLDSESPLREAMMDYESMRDADRACQAKPSLPGKL